MTCYRGTADDKAATVFQILVVGLIHAEFAVAKVDAMVMLWLTSVDYRSAFLDLIPVFDVLRASIHRCRLHGSF
jgi:hypothetical protein